MYIYIIIHNNIWLAKTNTIILALEKNSIDLEQVNEWCCTHSSIDYVQT